MWGLWVFALTLAAPAVSQTTLAPAVTSAAPERVGVTIYRAPDRSGPIDTDWLEGYALITETRRVTIPAGAATLRFESVAGGILAESAIVTGLPAGVSEKNLDADLLSPRTLYDRSLARPVTLRRTNPATGRVTETRAVIRSAAAGAMIVETAAGIEALQCAGLPEGLSYDRVPEGLSAKPTLSVETRSERPHEATVTLSYLTWGFDWQADYVVELAEGGRSARLFAWVTLASSDPTSFPDAATSVVAGKVNREDARGYERPEAGWLNVRCFSRPAPPPPPPPPAPPPPMAMALEEAGDEIIVSASRMERKRMAVQEDLGDLKLYRVPFPTTVAANAQKQVAMIDKAGVPVAIEYRSDSYGDTRIFITARNRTDAGLGVPLPAGPVAVFEPGGRGRLLVGEGSVADKAVGEKVEIDVAAATQVRAEVTELDEKRDDRERLQVVVTNANPFAVTHEYRFQPGDARVRSPSARLTRDGADQVWRATIPANGSARFTYVLEEQD